MKILSMTARFGKLNQTLTLHEGLNVLQAPNESGKSTWCAFILAMLYGINTAEKKSKDNGYLPEKERYVPWSGAPMEGTMAIEWNGRRITLERTASKRVPMGKFSAYDTATGQPVPELDGKNCGEVLLGVERSVLERTAFFRQSGLALSQDPALEQRMSALITTGDEQNVYSLLEQRLRQLKNACGGKTGKGGQIGQCQARLEEISAKLDELSQLNRQLQETTREQQQLKLQLQQDEALLALHAQAENARRARQLAEAEEKEAALRQQYDHLATLCQPLPEEDTLHTLRQTLHQLSQQAQALSPAPPEPQAPVPPPVFQGLTAQEAEEQARADQNRYQEITCAIGESAPPALRGLTAGEAMTQAQRDLADAMQPPVPEPDVPEVFRGLDAGLIEKKANTDAAHCRRLMAGQRPSWLLPALGLALAAIGAGLLAVSALAGAILLGAGLIWAGIFSWLRQKKVVEYNQNQQEAAQILQRYRANMPDEILRLAQQCIQNLDNLNAQRLAQEQRQREILSRYNVDFPEQISAAAVRYAQQLTRRHQGQEILNRYRVSSPEALLPMAEDYRHQLEEFERLHAQWASACQRQQETRQALRQHQAEIFAQIATFSGRCDSFDAAEQAIGEAERLLQRTTFAKQALADAQAYREALIAATGTVTQVTDTPPAPEEPEEQIRARADSRRHRLEQVNNQLSLLQGKQEAICDPIRLTAEQEELSAHLRHLQQELAAIQLASDHLKRANDLLQARFAPKIAEQAGRLFNRLTDGRYDRLLLQQDLSAKVSLPDSPILRPSVMLSCGTVEQLYLAVRLAMVNLLLGGDAPLILDDALVNFDDRRAALALQVLRDEAKQRQILLFTCQSREERLLREAEHKEVI